MAVKLVDGADFVIKQIRFAGIQVPPGSRLFSQHAALKMEPRSVGRDYRIAVEAVRDVSILTFSFNELGVPQPSTEYHRIVKRCVTGAVLGEEDPQHAKGRNAQAELFIGAVCAKGGMKPQFVEPDIEVQLDDRRFVVAVKRIRSLDRFTERFKEAADQIEESGRPGFAVIDTTEAFGGRAALLRPGLDNEQVNLGLLRLHDDFMKRRYDAMKRWIQGRQVRGLFTIEIMPHMPDGVRWVAKTFTCGVCFSSDHARRRRDFQRFQKRFTAGFPTTPASVAS